MSDVTEINVGGVLRQLRIKRNLTLSELSEAIGEKISTSTLNRMELKNLTLTLENLKILADFHGRTIASIIAEAENPGSPNPRGRAENLIPVIAWRDLRTWINPDERQSLIDDALHIVAPCPVSRGTFAMQVHGNSMQSAEGDSYPANYWIVIEPKNSVSTFYDGDAVIVQPASGVGVFRRIVHEGADTYLKPINPDYKTTLLADENDIVGTVIFAFRGIGFGAR